MRRELFILVSASALALGAAAACSSSSTTTNPAGTDSGVNTKPATDDSGATGDTDSGGDTDAGGDLDSGVVADASLNGCGAFTDNSAKTEVDLTWGFGISTDANRCSKIKVGSVVKWTGDFTVHPLTASMGGDTPNPIGGTPDAGSITVAFPTAGNFPYNCVNHPTLMLGVIQVVP